MSFPVRKQGDPCIQIPKGTIYQKTQGQLKSLCCALLTGSFRAILHIGHGEPSSPRTSFWICVFHFRDCGNLQAPFNELMFCHNKQNLSDPFRKDEALLGRLKTDSSSSNKNHFLQKSRLVIPLPLQRFYKKFMRLENPIILVSKDRCKICIWDSIAIWNRCVLQLKGNFRMLL